MRAALLVAAAALAACANQPQRPPPTPTAAPTPSYRPAIEAAGKACEASGHRPGTAEWMQCTVTTARSLAGLDRPAPQLPAATPSPRTPVDVTCRPSLSGSVTCSSY